MRTLLIMSFVLVAGQSQTKDIIRSEYDGIRIYHRKDQENFIKEILPSIKEAKKQSEKIVNSCKKLSLEFKENPKVIESLSLESQVGMGLFSVCNEFIGIDVPLPMHKETWRGLYGLFRVLLDNLEIFSKIFSMDTVKVVSVDDLKTGRIPFWAIDNWKLGLSFARVFENKRDIAAYRRFDQYVAVEVNEYTLAFPVYQGRLFGINVQEWLKKCEASFSNIPLPSSLDVNRLIQTVIVEYIKVMIRNDLKVRDPLARWFYEGTANYIAQECIKKVFGDSAYLKTSFNHQDRDIYLSKKERINLLAWAAEGIDELELIEEPMAHKFFATEITRELLKKEPSIIKKLFSVLRHSKKELLYTEDILESLSAISPDAAKNFSEALTGFSANKKLLSSEEMTILWSEKKYDKLLGALDDYIKANPRGTDARIKFALVASVAQPEKFATRFVQEASIVTELGDNRLLNIAYQQWYYGVLVHQEYQPGLTYCLGRWAEEIGYLALADIHYRMILAGNPDHMPTRERYGLLREKIDYELGRAREVIFNSIENSRTSHELTVRVKQELNVLSQKFGSARNIISSSDKKVILAIVHADQSFKIESDSDLVIVIGNKGLASAKQAELGPEKGPLAAARSKKGIAISMGGKGGDGLAIKKIGSRVFYGEDGADGGDGVADGLVGSIGIGGEAGLGGRGTTPDGWIGASDGKTGTGSGVKGWEDMKEYIRKTRLQNVR